MPAAIPLIAGFAASAAVGSSVVLGIGAVGWGIIAGAVAGGVVAATQDQNVLEGAVMGGLSGWAGAGLANAFSANGISGLTEEIGGGVGKTGEALTLAQEADSAGTTVAELQAAKAATPAVTEAATTTAATTVPEANLVPKDSMLLGSGQQTVSPLYAPSPLANTSMLNPTTPGLTGTENNMLKAIQAMQPQRNALGMTTGETLGVAASLAPALGSIGGSSSEDAQSRLAEVRAANETFKGLAPSGVITTPLYRRTPDIVVNPNLARR